MNGAHHPRAHKFSFYTIAIFFCSCFSIPGRERCAHCTGVHWIRRNTWPHPSAKWDWKRHCDNEQNILQAIAFPSMNISCNQHSENIRARQQTCIVCTVCTPRQYHWLPVAMHQTVDRFYFLFSANPSCIYQKCSEWINELSAMTLLTFFPSFWSSNILSTTSSSRCHRTAERKQCDDEMRVVLADLESQRERREKCCVMA